MTSCQSLEFVLLCAGAGWWSQKLSNYKIPVSFYNFRVTQLCLKYVSVIKPTMHHILPSFRPKVWKRKPFKKDSSLHHSKILFWKRICFVICSAILKPSIICTGLFREDLSLSITSSLLLVLFCHSVRKQERKQYLLAQSHPLSQTSWTPESLTILYVKVQSDWTLCKAKVVWKFATGCKGVSTCSSQKQMGSEFQSDWVMREISI